ncbi:SDR family oxidoreductase [Nocardia brasiliensis]|uniref:SDR family oxidoreductase n=1 Tax=Nocardia brasiliensis TaxID=37326 RepID=UPI0032AFDB7B
MDYNERRLEGATVVVMGASAGIGLAAARALANAGAEVTITGRNRKNLDEAVALLDHQKISVARVDGTDEHDVREFFAHIELIDHLVVAFGGDDTPEWFRDTEIARWRRHFDDKFFAQLRVLQYALPRMRRDGSITVATGSVARSAIVGAALWAATDGAMDAAIPTLALEFAPVRLNAITPGVIHTRWWDRMPAAQRHRMFDKVARRIPLGRVGTADEVGHAVRFLAENDYVTGVVLGVDGGASLVG